MYFALQFGEVYGKLCVREWDLTCAPHSLRQILLSLYDRCCIKCRKMPINVKKVKK